MVEPTQIKDSETQDSTQTLEEMRAQLDEFRTFVARRFDEVSMEVNATSQLLDMAEEDAETRFKNMIATLQSISETGDGISSANTGRELESAVVEAEKAANTILDSAERIGGLIQAKIVEDESEEMQKFLISIDFELQNILLACSFQDLVGQRIRKALENVKNVETQLSSTLSDIGVDIEPSEEEKQAQEQQNATVASQDDIDSLFD